MVRARIFKDVQSASTVVKRCHDPRDRQFPGRVQFFRLTIVSHCNFSLSKLWQHISEFITFLRASEIDGHECWGRWGVFRFQPGDFNLTLKSAGRAVKAIASVSISESSLWVLSLRRESTGTICIRRRCGKGGRYPQLIVVRSESGDRSRAWRRKNALPPFDKSPALSYLHRSGKRNPLSVPRCICSPAPFFIQSPGYILLILTQL